MSVYAMKNMLHSVFIQSPKAQRNRRMATKGTLVPCPLCLVPCALCLHSLLLILPCMEIYGKILLIAMPSFLLPVLFEKWWGWYKGRDTVRNMDMVSSLSSGITNVTKDVLGLSISVITYRWLVDKVAIVHVQSTLWTYVIAFIVLDFAGYWMHRWSH